MTDPIMQLSTFLGVATGLTLGLVIVLWIIILRHGDSLRESVRDIRELMAIVRRMSRDVEQLENDLRRLRELAAERDRIIRAAAGVKP